MLADRCGEVFQFLDIEFFARLAGVARDYVNCNLCGATSVSLRRLLTGGDEGIESFAEAGSFGHEYSLQINIKTGRCLSLQDQCTGTPSPSSNSFANAAYAFAPTEDGE